MDAEKMLEYIGDKKDPKVIDMFKEIRDKARTLAKHIDTLALEADAKPKGYRPTDAEDKELGVMCDNIFKAIADLGFSVDLLCTGDGEAGNMIEMFEHEVMCKEFLAARAMPERERPEHDCGDCPINKVCPTSLPMFR